MRKRFPWLEGLTLPQPPVDVLFRHGLHDLARQYDPARGMVATTAQGNTDALGLVRETMLFAYAAWQRDGEAALPSVERVLPLVLDAQERDLRHPHLGNFKWFFEQDGVTDLNAVQFVLENLLPLLSEAGHLLSPELRARALGAVALAADELERLDVHLSYTNIALLDVLNRVLAAQLLNDDARLARGRARLAEWTAWTLREGVTEYNSPVYGGVDLGALAELAEGARDATTSLRAVLLEERLWLHTLLHYHAPTAQLAGPHSRAYHNDVTGGVGFAKLALYRVTGDDRLLWPSAVCAWRQTTGHPRIARHPYHLPLHLRALAVRGAQGTVVETAHAQRDVRLTTYATSSYALGSVSHGDSPQGDHLLLHYRRAGERGFGVVYARFLLDDHAFGSFFHDTDRTWFNNLNDEGQFWSVQHEGKVVALYGLKPNLGKVRSVRTDVIVRAGERPHEVWVNEARVEALPRELAPHDTLFVADGEVMLAVRPLALTRLDRDTPIVLSERDGELVLSLYNYRGSPRGFWEYANFAGPFFKGNLRAGFVLEVGEGAREDFAAFRARVSASVVRDELDGGVRRVAYASGADLLELDVDLRAHRTLARRVNGAPLQESALRAPLVAQGEGQLRVGACALHLGSGAAGWLVADDAAGCWGAVNATDAVTSWQFATPQGEVRCAAFGLGRMVWHADGLLEVFALERRAPLVVRASVGVRVRWNGRDMPLAPHDQEGMLVVRAADGTLL